ncbi:hypothetical protein KR067_001657 [Drosophila pandora]|nr:hypothetical protein KR067_001657 [Drosophila pandora]
MSTAALTILFASYFIIHQASAMYLEPDCGIVDRNSKNSNPWMALIRNKTDFLCTGTLISNHKIIKTSYKFRRLVRLGESQNLTTAEEYSVKKAYVHVNFSSETLENNIALLEFHKVVTFQPHIRPICILISPKMKSWKDQAISFRSTFWVQNPNGFVADNWVVDRHDRNCDNPFGWRVTESQICVGPTNFDSCSPGNPISRVYKHENSLRHIQLGLLSSCGSNGIYTDVVSFFTWIMERVWDIEIIMN